MTGRGIFQREVLAGANAVTPYVAARYTASWPLFIGPLAMAVLTYSMTGAEPAAGGGGGGRRIS